MVKKDLALHFFCGKIASGKTTLSKQLASTHHAILLSEDLWLSKLYPEEIRTFDDYLKYSSRLKPVVARHVQDILARGISVVLDFPGNVPSQRQWFRSIFEAAGVNHVLHYLVASDSLCKAQLQKRNIELPEGSAIVSEAEFDYITSYFQPPIADESFNIIRYEADQIRTPRLKSG
jgi:predicted kinase